MIVPFDGHSSMDHHRDHIDSFIHFLFSYRLRAVNFTGEGMEHASA